ncbi:unnamed protein product [Parnassius apollo]|uniref:(apollo) hypothetical protein n=1 Tax=Parnassius apollo TaxID=110799 RepID=A0A8S3WY92_PARAO|nr:unnamed protein product [Parnassius apollo]
MAPGCNESPILPATAEEVTSISKYNEVVNKLATCIVSAVNDAKSVTAANKRLITIAAEEIRRANLVLTNITSTISNPAEELKNDIITSVREEINQLKKSINNTAQNRSSYAEVASSNVHQSTTKNKQTAAPPITKPAIIVTPKTEVQNKQEAINVWRKSISFRASKYAPTRVQAVSNNKVRVEFDSEEDRDETLKRLSDSKDVTAEPARKFRPMIILKGISVDTASEELLDIIKFQNADLTELITQQDDLRLCFKRTNKNPNLYNAVFRVQPNLWRKIINIGRLSIDHQRIHVEEFSPFMQCHKCYQFGHTKNKCTAENTVCGYCSETTHHIFNCPHTANPERAQCTNCVGHNSKFNTKLETKHKATSTYCPRLRIMREKILNRIDYGSNQ